MLAQLGLVLAPHERQNNGEDDKLGIGKAVDDVSGIQNRPDSVRHDWKQVFGMVQASHQQPDQDDKGEHQRQQHCRHAGHDFDSGQCRKRDRDEEQRVYGVSRGFFQHRVFEKSADLDHNASDVPEHDTSEGNQQDERQRMAQQGAALPD